MTLGAAIAESGAHVPSVPPVSAAEQAMQSGAPPPHAASQHTPSTQNAPPQSATVVHGVASAAPGVIAMAALTTRQIARTQFPLHCVMPPA